MLQDGENLTVKATGWLGAVVGVVLFLAIAVPFGVFLWRNFGKPARDRWNDRRSIRRQIAFNEFRIQWLLDHSDKGIFVLDEEQHIVFVNDKMTELLQTDSSELEGTEWHKFVKDADLDRVLAKWDRAFAKRSPYTNVSELRVGRRTQKFLVQAQPFVYNRKPRAYFGTITPYEDFEASSPKLLGE